MEMENDDEMDNVGETVGRSESMEGIDVVDRSQDQVIICVDTSVSTEGCYEYYMRINNVINDAMNRYQDVRIISWNTNAKYCLIEELEPDGGTQPVSFLRLLKCIDSKYHLIVTTDGELFDREVDACTEILKNTNVLSNILSFKVYFIGDINDMNLRLSDLFINVNDKKIIINDQEPILICNIDIDKLTYDDLVHNDNIIGSILEFVKLHPEKRDEVRVKLCRKNTSILAGIARHTSIRCFYENNDVNGCVEFVRKFDPTDKSKFEKVMSKLIEICSDKNVDLYSLSHLVNSRNCHETFVPINHYEVEEEMLNGDCNVSYSAKSDEEENNITCDITLLKSNNPCAEIVCLQNDQDEIFSNDESKIISHNPWLILNNAAIINKIIKRVGHYTYDLITKNRMDEAYIHYTSAFTRQEIYGVFIFHCNNDKIDYNLVFKNNNRTLSFMFNKNYKLPGNKSVWNVLFLYILAEYHPFWKQYSKMIREEIINILPQLSSFITLNPLLNPPIIDGLDVCLWYIINVSHCAFPNSTKNILRYIEGPQHFLEIYKFIYPNFDAAGIKYKIKVWNAWKYLIRNRTCKRLRLEVISQYQNHEIIGEDIVFLSGDSDRQSIDLKPLHTYNLYNHMLKKPSATLFENIPYDELDNGRLVPVEGICDSVDEVYHVKICLRTVRPLYVCPLSKTVWNDCANKFNVKKESFFRAFIKFCESRKKYPETAEEFLVYHSNNFNYNNDSDFIVFGNNIKKCFAAVLEKYSRAMEMHSPKDLVWTYRRNSEVDIRLKNEKSCNCDSH